MRKTRDAHAARNGLLQPGRLWVMMLIVGLAPACGGGGGGGGTAGGGGGSVTFDSNGTLIEDVTPGNESANCLATDGISLFVAGVQDTTGSTDSAWRIEKRSLPDGALVSAFGSGGALVINPSGANDSAVSLALDASFLYVAGTQLDPLIGTQCLWRIEKRSLTTGAPDAGFGTAGVVTSDPSASLDAPVKLVVAGGFLYAIGLDEIPGAGDREWRIEKRSTTTGALDAGFGTGGVITVNPTSLPDSARDIALDATFMYIVGSTSAGIRIEKRLLTTGALDAGFGTAGVITQAISSMDGIAIDATYLYAVGSDSVSFGDTEIRIEKRLLTTGALVAGFGTAGVLTVNPSAGSDYARSVLLDSGNLYIFGADQTPGSNTGWRVEKRSTADGSLAGTFGTGGVLQINPSSMSLEEATGGVVAGSFIYFTGADFGFGARWRMEKRPK